MDILYISSVCSQSKFDQLVKEGKISSQFQNQKFHNLLLSGLRRVSSDSITVVSYYPILRKYNDIEYEEENNDGIKYIYPSCYDFPIINHFSKYYGAYYALKKNLTHNSIIVCNIMNFDECIAALHIGKKYGNKVVAIVADVPGKTSGANSKNGAYWKRILASMTLPYYRSFASKYDGYILLTEAMNIVVNPKNEPSIVVEGFSDSRMKDFPNSLNLKNQNKVLMYAGGLHKEYGIDLLVEAFEHIPHDGWELHLYGAGNYVPILEQKIKKDSSIKFFGTKNNNEIVEAQIKATLLINPRPTNEEFVKYSFPSKTLECMASGTPLVTTNLPGMPEDYKNHVFLMNDETIEGYANVLSLLFSKERENLHKFGMESKEFVLKEKNNIAQASRIYHFLNNI